MHRNHLLQSYIASSADNHSTRDIDDFTFVLFPSNTKPKQFSPSEAHYGAIACVEYSTLNLAVTHDVVILVSCRGAALAKLTLKLRPVTPFAASSF